MQSEQSSFDRSLPLSFRPSTPPSPFALCTWTTAVSFLPSCFLLQPPPPSPIPLRSLYRMCTTEQEREREGASGRKRKSRRSRATTSSYTVRTDIARRGGRVPSVDVRWLEAGGDRFVRIWLGWKGEQTAREMGKGKIATLKRGKRAGLRWRRAVDKIFLRVA